MFDRYYPQVIEGRPLKYIPSNRGKKHFWGVKGKNYGFYTTNEEIQMQKRYSKHRRINSQIAQYPNQRNKDNRNRFFTIQANDNPQYIQQKFVEKPYNKRQMTSSFIQKSQIGIQKDFQIRQSQSERKIQIKKGDNEKQMKKQQKFMYPEQNMELRLPSINKRQQPKKQKDEFNLQKNLIRIDEYKPQKSRLSRIDKSQLLQNQSQKQQINIYYKRNRKDNPTYCNSFAYPLPCYRYVA